MTATVGQPERSTQNRVAALLQRELGYHNRGWLDDTPDNSNIESGLLLEYLTLRAGYSTELAKRAIYTLQQAANNRDLNLYHRNRAVYQLLRYGIEASTRPDERYQRVHVIDWQHPERNDFSFAEEVTLTDHRTKRPDIVLYINGIAIGVLELKRSTVSIGEAVRQSIVNQREDGIEAFFSTIQLILAGNDTEGLRYGTISSAGKHFLRWREDEHDASRLQLDKYLLKLCDKKRLLELLHDFVLFDGGIKKLPRYHQYFGIKAAQEYVRRREGGIIWHTQGSGKSLVMVLLARWILEQYPHARVAIITDRTELDKQIERVFTDAGEPVKRTASGRELLQQLAQPTPRLLCSLVHKFGKKEEQETEAWLRELQHNPPPVSGDLFVFVDECHRTQSGTLHQAMKAMLPHAVFFGFTGTPLLKKDKKTSLEVFGRYIHTYKFNEAVEDEVVLDLVYEARDIDQRLTSPARVDEWFDLTTAELNDFQKSELKKKWGTMQQVLSAKSRIEKIVFDIRRDFRKKPRLSSQEGNAILVAKSIYDACRYYEAFQQTEFRGRCAVITSYNPTYKDINTEDIGENTDTAKEYVYKTYEALLKPVVPVQGKSKTETYEDNAKQKFIGEPANMRLLIVVDKLLTGFDAPPCSYLYIDKSMQDHGLFQAICRVNRLDGDTKPFGYIVDYMDLFQKVEDAVSVYTSELEYDTFRKEDCDILLQDRLKKGRERLEQALEMLSLLCEPVEPPKSPLEYQRYFCINPDLPEALKESEPRRMALYKGIVALIRAWANVEEDLTEVGFSAAEQTQMRAQVDFYLTLREEIRIASAETLDMKPYEADMRHLIDHYILADEPRIISPFEQFSLLDLIAKTGIEDAINALPEGIKGNQTAVAEAIENNVRRKIIRDRLLDPALFAEMSQLLEEIIRLRRENALSYEELLRRYAELAARLSTGVQENLPATLRTPAQRTLFRNLGENEALALEVHEQVIRYKPDGWRNMPAKEQIVKKAIFDALGDTAETERIFDLIKKQTEY